MAYIVASWILIQLGYIVARNYAAPDWVMGVVITLLVCGFPVALYFSWTFALTTDGLRKESDVRKHDHLVRKSGEMLDYITMALLAGVVGMVALDRYMPVPGETGQQATTKSAEIPAEPEPDHII